MLMAGSSTDSLLSGQSSLQSGAQRAIIQIVKLAANGYALGQARNTAIVLLQFTRDIMRSGLPLHGGAGC